MLRGRRPEGKQIGQAIMGLKDVPNLYGRARWKTRAGRAGRASKGFCCKWERRGWGERGL